MAGLGQEHQFQPPRLAAAVGSVKGRSPRFMAMDETRRRTNPLAREGSAAHGLRHARPRWSAGWGPPSVKRRAIETSNAAPTAIVGIKPIGANKGHNYAEFGRPPGRDRDRKTIVQRFLGALIAPSSIFGISHRLACLSSEVVSLAPINIGLRAYVLMRGMNGRKPGSH
jgi:hypothetical protein